MLSFDLTPFMSVALQPHLQEAKESLHLSQEQKRDYNTRKQQAEFQFLFEYNTGLEEEKQALLNELRQLMREDVLFALRKVRKSGMLEIFVDEQTPEEVLQQVREKIQIWFEAKPENYPKVFLMEENRRDAGKMKRLNYEALATL